jgi:hypothetical protein
MSEETGSAEAGNPEAAAPSGETSATTEAATPQWIDGVQNAETRSWAESKGLQNGTLENVLGSYHNLEKLMGAEKAGRTVTMLGDDASQDEVNDFYGKLGRPKDAAGYGFQVPEGDDGTFAKWAGDVFHDAGLTTKQASMISEKWGEYAGGIQQANEDKAHISSVDATAELKKEWGAAFDVKVAGIEVAANKLGMTDGELEGLHSAMGPVAAMKFVDSLNTKIGEHSFDSGEKVTPNHKTPEQARQEMGELSMNKEFMDAWLDRQHPGHAAAIEKKAALSRLVSGVV